MPETAAQSHAAIPGGPYQVLIFSFYFQSSRIFYAISGKLIWQTWTSHKSILAWGQFGRLVRVNNSEWFLRAVRRRSWIDIDRLILNLHLAFHVKIHRSGAGKNRGIRAGQPGEILKICIDLFMPRGSSRDHWWNESPIKISLILRRRRKKSFLQLDENALFTFP